MIVLELFAGSRCISKAFEKACPRKAQTGTQGMKNWKDRSKIPEELCQHIVNICEEK